MKTKNNSKKSIQTVVKSATQVAMTTIPATGKTEATEETVKTDIARSNAVLNGTQSPDAFVEAEDILTCRADAEIWNFSMAEKFETINLRDKSCVHSRFEYVPSNLILPSGRKSRYQALTCSDNGLEVGKPFASSYGLLNNADFIGIVESIQNVLTTLGLKSEINTTGFLQNRERSFITIKIDQNSSTVIDGREFKQFLNCLNSIPSNSGCTVTFANNSFCVCCRNTFSHCLHGRDGTKFHCAIKHTKGMKAALADIPVLVEAYFASNEALFANLKAFSVFPMGLQDAEEYFAAFLARTAKGELTDKTELKSRSANMVDALTNLFVKGKGNKGETALDLFQAVTEYYTHFSAGETEDKTKQFESSEIGSGAVNKGEFYSWLVAMMQGKDKAFAKDAVCKVGNTLLVAYRNKA